MQQLWLVTIPTNKSSSETVFQSLSNTFNGSKDGSCRLHRFTIPPLVVGTLDSLMSLSDDLNKITSQVEVTCSIGLDLFFNIFLECCSKN